MPSIEIENDLERFKQALAEASSEIRSLLNLWQEARGTGLVPNRRDIDPTRIPRLLPNVFIYRWDDEVGDFVCKLAGEDINSAWGRSIAGLRLRDVVGELDHPVVLTRWKRIVSVPVVHFGSAQERMSAQELASAERLILPLEGSDGTVDHVLGLSLYKLVSRRDSRKPLLSEDIIQVPCELLR